MSMAQQHLPVVRLVRLGNWPIARQLWLEEALLRHDARNWCLVNAVPGPSTVVVGLSGKVASLLRRDLIRRDGVPVVRRFTGGGTVVVGSGTVVATLIVNKADAPCGPFPREIMEYTGEAYADVFKRLGEPRLRLRENDYIVDDAIKVGGNAQAIVRTRWLHHTSFLYDFRDADMDYLTLPSRRPAYRGDRDHSAFVTRLAPRLSDPAIDGADNRLALQLKEHLPGFQVHDAPLDDALAVLHARGPAWHGGTHFIDVFGSSSTDR